MKNRIEEITSWKPLTEWQRFGLAVLRDLGVITFTVFAFAVTTTISAHQLKYEAFRVTGLVAYLVCIPLLIATILLSQRIALARKKLNLEKQAVIYWLEDDKLCVCGPCLLEEARKLAFHLCMAKIAFVLPLQRGLEGEVYLRGNDPMILDRFLSKWRIKSESMIWTRELSDLSHVHIADCEGEALKMPMRTALQLMDDIRNNHNMGSWWMLFASKLKSVSRAEDTSHKTTNALILAVNTLRDREKFTRSLTPARGLANTLAEVLANLLADTDSRRGDIIPDTLPKRKETRA